MITRYNGFPYRKCGFLISFSNPDFRRFSKRIYVTLPDAKTRVQLLRQLLAKHKNPLTNPELHKVAELTEGYSGSDLTGLAKDAALGPIRGNFFPPQNNQIICVYFAELNAEQLRSLDPNNLRNISIHDFYASLKRVRNSLSLHSLAAYEKWNQQYGDVSI